MYTVEYEIDGSTTILTKHYDAGGQRVAVRNGTSLNYLLNDHLGSTSVILKTNGGLWGELRYSAWGQTRYSYGNIATTRQFTGQINDGATGLYYYNARYYDPALHRFIQADTIVPDPNNPQTLNRFSYTNNNPVRYTDPTGHCVAEAENDSSHEDHQCWVQLYKIMHDFEFISLDARNWSFEELVMLYKMVQSHDFRSTFDNKRIIIGRQANPAVAQEGELWGGYVQNAGDYNIMLIFDGAYLIPPDVNGVASSPSNLNFMGTLYHEFMHIAVMEDPDLLTSFASQVSQYGEPTVGASYAYEEDTTLEQRNNEVLAMSATTVKLQPQTLRDSSEYWVFSWVHYKAFRSRISGN